MGAAEMASTHFGGDLVRVARSVEQVILHDAEGLDDAFLDVFGEAGGVSSGDADILIQMKQFHARPINSLLCPKLF